MPQFSLRLMILSLGVTALLSACSSPPPPLRLPEMAFTAQAPIRLDVARIDIVANYQAPTAKPHIEYDMPVSPENALRLWVRDHLKAVGNTGVMRLVIRNASATERPLTTDQSLSGMFKKEVSALVELNLDVELQMLDERQFVVTSVAGDASRSLGELEGQKLNERDRLLYDLTYDLIKGFGEKVDPNIRSGFNKWIVLN